MFVNPSRRRTRNAPKPWAKLYAAKYYSLTKKRKKRKASSRKRKPSSSHKKTLKRSHKKKNPRLTLNVSKKELKNMLSRRGSKKRRARRSRRSRRRNAGITPFVQNPMLRVNPRHSITRRRKRRNPMSLSFPSINTIMHKSLTYGGGAAIGTATNIFALNKIKNPWFRNGARVLVGCMGAPMLGGSLGAAAAGALFAPLVTELAVALHLPVATEADLEADLQDLLDDMDEGEPSGVDISDTEDSLW